MDTTLDTMKHSESDLNLDLRATAKKGIDDDDTPDHPYGVFFDLLYNINENDDSEEDTDMNLSIDLGEDDDLSIDENDDGESVDF
jgi:hypothetical protein